MNAPLDHRRLQIHTHQARLAESTVPTRVRTIADPRWRRVAASVGHQARRVRRVVRRVLVVSGPEPVRGANPAMLGRHPCPEAPPR